MNWQRALSEVAYVMGELHAVRDAGFTAEALKYPRSADGLVALCAFNGISPEQAPRGWHYWPNVGMKKCWERVIEALKGTSCQTPAACSFHEECLRYPKPAAVIAKER